MTSRWPPDEAPTADSVSGDHSHWPSRRHRGIGSANVKRASACKADQTDQYLGRERERERKREREREREREKEREREREGGGGKKERVLGMCPTLCQIIKAGSESELLSQVLHCREVCNELHSSTSRGCVAPKKVS